MTTQTTTTFVGVVGRNENLFRETKSGGSAGGNQANFTAKYLMIIIIKMRRAAHNSTVVVHHSTVHTV